MPGDLSANMDWFPLYSEIAAAGMKKAVPMLNNLNFEADSKEGNFRYLFQRLCLQEEAKSNS